MKQAGPESVTARLSYVDDTGETPVNYPSEAGGREETDIGTDDVHSVTIQNARLRYAPFSLERNGFTLIQQPEPQIDLYDDDAVEEEFRPAVAKLLKEKLNARRVFVFDHTRRADDTAVRRDRRVRGPAALVHNDYTEQSGIWRLRDFLPDEVDGVETGRLQIINLWRSLSGPVERSPLAICDAATVAAEDPVVTERRARDRIGAIYRYRHNPAHRWYYYPQLQPDEAILIRTFDSASNTPMLAAPHCAFDDPSAPASAAPRCSIDLRAFVLH